ncbi:MAG: hypothetical protein Q9P01_10550 [Anaerolineae bacterium]|nr:hypothetical protein [Anaerolineae bacterium]
MDWEEADDETTVDDLAQTEQEMYFQRAAQQASFWQMIRRFFFQTPSEKRAEQQQRLSDLNLAIVNNPDIATNYMLRGEIYLEKKSNMNSPTTIF